MKILQFIYELVPGGAERFVVDLTNELALNNETILYSLRDDTNGNSGFYVPEINQKVTYVNLKIKPGFKPGLIWAFFKIIKNEKPDIVHCHLNLVNYFFLLSLLFHKKVRFFYTIHNPPETEVKSAVEKIIRQFFFRHNFFVPVAISEATKISFQNYHKLTEVPVIYNGRKFSGKTINYSKTVDELSLFKKTRKTLIFCHVSRYDEIQKNQLMLVRVFNRLMDEGYDIILLIIGEGFENADPLKVLAKDHIHFLGIKSNVNDYLYASDAFCLSSNFEGMPISLIEAFGCGCVPVCTPVGGIINTIENGVNGFLSKTVSENDYMEAVKQFINQGNTIDKERLIRYYHENFSIEKCASGYIKLYCEK